MLALVFAEQLLHSIAEVAVLHTQLPSAGSEENHLQDRGITPEVGLQLVYQIGEVPSQRREHQRLVLVG